MKLSQIILAFPGLKKIAACDLTMKDLFHVKQKIREVQPHIDFYVEQARRFEGNTAKLAELYDMDIELSPAIKIVPPETLALSYSDLVNLEGIIEIRFLNE